METIFALASGRPPAAIAVIRISGPEAFAVLAALTARPLPALRTMVVRRLTAPDAVVLDTAMVVRFAAPASPTGEDVVELHLHGGPAVVAAVLTTLGAMPRLRVAEPGEFTRRAFETGKLDLTQVEGLADLIDAETETQRRQALAATSGGLTDLVDDWRSTLLAVRADLEATLDFADEEGVPAGLSQGNRARLGDLAEKLQAAIVETEHGERIRDGLVVAVTGPPNVGKSSLVNALARRDVAIVSPHAGTTRDVIEVRLDLGGVAVTLLDTAGLRASDDPVEAEGIARARRRAAAADLVLALGYPPPADALGIAGMADLNAGAGWRDGVLHLSPTTGDGVSLLVDWLTQWARTTVRTGEPAVFTRARHRWALLATVVHLEAAVAITDTVLVAECLREASDSLAAIIGSIAPDDVLGAIFGRFCIGK